MSLHPSLALVRRGVRDVLADLPDRATVVVACSGGADSLALLAATVFEARRPGHRVVGATVDHGLQPGSDAHARHVVEQMAELGVDETVGVRVHVEDPGIGPEAAARQARYAVLGQVAARTGAVAVLLGHTRDDQAETVLLGLTRGSGGRSIAGMRRAYAEDGVVFARPLLDVARADTETACRVEGLAYWTDPHNADPAYTRSRLRHRVMPVLEEELGPGVAAALARTADGLREDAELLDDLADEAYARVVRTEGASTGSASGGGSASEGGRATVTLRVDGLAELAPALRRRVIRLAALRAGSPASELFREHVLAVESLVTGWRGQRWIDLPGHLRAVRRDGHVLLEGSRPGPTG